MTQPTRVAHSILLLVVFAFSGFARAQTLTTVLTFDVTNGSTPEAGVMQGTDGNLHGTTYHGGSNSDGTAFTITKSGTPVALYSFCSQPSCADGTQPEAGLIQAANGIYYGTTYVGGAHGQGTVFKLTAAGKLTTLSSFCAQTSCTDGQDPVGGLIQATNGDFYGTTTAGEGHGHGNVFKITPAGAAIHYTTDGKTPSKSSPLYTMPLTVSSSETLEAIAIAAGDAHSTVTKASYIID